MIPKKSLGEAYQLFFQNLFNFNGRTRRSDYWRVVIINSLVMGAVSSALTAIFGSESAVGSAISSILSLAVSVLELGLVVRRLHDTGKEWTYILFSLIPFVGWIIVFIALVKDSDPGDNKFGPNPKGVTTGSFSQTFNPQGFDPNQGFNQPQQGFGAAPNYQEPAAPVAPVAPVYQDPAAPAAPTFEAPQAPTFEAPAAPVEPAAPAFDAPQAPAFEAPAAPVEPAAPAFEAPAAEAPAFEAPAAPVEAAAPSFCTACGTPIPAEANACPNCGAPKA